MLNAVDVEMAMRLVHWSTQQRNGATQCCQQGSRTRDERDRSRLAPTGSASHKWQLRGERFDRVAFGEGSAAPVQDLRVQSFSCVPILVAG